MNLLKITRLEPNRVVSFHIADSLTPEEEVFGLYFAWAEENDFLPEYRFLPLLGFNHPWGPMGERRGYEIFCFLGSPDAMDLAAVTMKEFAGGLFAVTTVPGLDLIRDYATKLRRAVERHPRYQLAYPANYRHGVDPSPELEMVYTPKAKRPEDFVLDYFIPIEELERT